MDFGETLESLKLCKSYDGDMKFYARKNQIIKEKIVSTIFIKRFYSQVLNILLLALNKKKNHGCTILDIEKLQKKPISFRKTKASRILKGIAKLGTIWDELASQVLKFLKKLFVKNILWQHLEYEL